MRCHCIAVNIVSRYGFETPLTALLNARTFYSKRHSDFGASTPIQFRIFQDFAISHVSKFIKSVHKGFRIQSGKLTRLSMTKTQGRCTKITLHTTTAKNTSWKSIVFLEKKIIALSREHIAAGTMVWLINPQYGTQCQNNNNSKRQRKSIHKILLLLQYYFPYLISSLSSSRQYYPSSYFISGNSCNILI